VIVVNKADHPMTDTMVREIRGVLSLAGAEQSWKVPILRTEAVKAEGVEELVQKIDEHRAHITEEGTLERRRSRNLRNEVLGIAASRMRRRLDEAVADDDEIAALLDRVVKRELDPASAAGELLERETDG